MILLFFLGCVWVSGAGGVVASVSFLFWVRGAAACCVAGRGLGSEVGRGLGSVVGSVVGCGLGSGGVTEGCDVGCLMVMSSVV